MRIKLLAILAVPLLAYSETRLESGAVVQPATIGVGIRLTVPDVDRETALWQLAVLANGGSYSAADTRAVDYFVRQCKFKGIWGGLDWVALFAGRNLNAALVPLKRTVGDAVIVNSNFIEADFSPNAGLTGNGMTKELFPGLNQNQCRAVDDVSLGVYVSAFGSPGSLRGLFTGTTTSGSRLQVFVESTNTNMAARVNNTTAIASGTGTVTGMIGASRIPSETASYVFFNGNETSAEQSPSSGSAPMTLFSRSSTSYFNGTLAGAWFGAGLTSSQRLEFREIWNATMALLGRDLQLETQAWKNAVASNGGTLSTTDIQAADYFVSQCKAKGLWELLDWVALFAGQNLNAARVPLKRTIGDAVIGNNNFSEGDFVPTIGLTGNGSSKDLVPGIMANQLQQNSVTAGVWVTGLPATGGSSRGLFGTTFGASPAFYLFRGSSGPTNARVFTASSTAVGGNTSIGLAYCRRTLSSTQVVGVNSNETSETAGSSSPTSSAIRIFSLAGATYNNGSLGAAFMGQGMTSTQVDSLRLILQQCMTMLGRPTS